jgi:hypothetical protein
MDGTKVNIAKNVNLPAQTVMTGRGCIIGQSGSGKSYLAGVIAEELCKLKLPFCIVDPEGEYYPLRSAFQVLIAGGENGDIGLDVDFHALFKSSIQNGLPVILDLSETIQKSELLNSALSELYLVEEELAMPYPIIVEEADKFVPQKGKTNDMLEEIAVRGRKKGLGLLIVSQRPANVDKNVLAQCSYGFIGKLVIENDTDAVSVFFSRLALRKIAKHNPGDFSSFGLGLNDTIHVRHMLTPHGGITPHLQPIATGERLAEVISDLKNSAVKTATNEASKTKTINALSLPQGISEEDVRHYADTHERKEFGVFGKKVESIEAINKRFISTVLVGIRLPAGHDGEYKEEYMMLDDRLRFIVSKDRISFFNGPIAGESRLLKEDYDVLSLLSKGRTNTISGISKALGMGIRAVRNSIGRLKLRRLVVSDREKTSLVNYEKYLMHDRPETVTISADASSIINQRVDERIEKDWARMLFPSASLFESERILLPVYEVKLRHGDRVRMLLVEAVHGEVIKW